MKKALFLLMSAIVILCLFSVSAFALSTHVVYLDNQVIGTAPDPNHVYKYRVTYTNGSGVVSSNIYQFTQSNTRQAFYVADRTDFTVEFIPEGLTDYDIGLQLGGNPMEWNKSSVTENIYYDGGAFCFYIRYNTAVKHIKLTKEAVGSTNPNTVYHFKALSHEYNYRFIEKDYYLKAGESVDILYVYIPSEDNTVYIKETDVPNSCTVSYTQGGSALSGGWPNYGDHDYWPAGVGVQSNTPDNVEVVCRNYYAPATITLTKKVVSGNPAAEGPFNFTLTVTDASGNPIDVSNIQQPSGSPVSVKAGTTNVLIASISGFNASGSKTISINVPKGSKVTVEEDSNNNFTVSNNGTNQNGGRTHVINSASNSSTVTFTNTKKAALTINKSLSGGDSNKNFPFEVTLKDSSNRVVKLAAGTYTPAGSVTYTVDANGKITFSLKANQKVIIQDIPSGTTASVTENNAQYYDVKFTYTNGTEKAGTSDSLTVRDNTSITVVNTAQNFYVVHHAVHGSLSDSVDTVPMYTLGTTNGVFDITEPFKGSGYDYTGYYNGIRVGYIYGGMYTGTHTTASGYNAISAENSFNGKSFEPEAGKYYYLREVSEEFLQPRIVSVRRHMNDTHLEHYLLTAVDSNGADNSFYTEYGFSYDVNAANYEDYLQSGHVRIDSDQEIYDPSVDIQPYDKYDTMTCALYEYIDVYKYGSLIETYTPGTVFSNRIGFEHITNSDYFGCVPYDESCAEAGGGFGNVLVNNVEKYYDFHYTPYYITADGVFVSGIYERYTDISKSATVTAATNYDIKLENGSVTYAYNDDVISGNPPAHTMTVFSHFSTEPLPITEPEVEAENLVSLSLDGSIGINFYLDLDAYKNVGKVTVTYTDPTKEAETCITDTYTEFEDFASNGKYIFTANASAAQTTESIIVTIYDENNRILYSKKTSVRDILESYIKAYEGKDIGELCENMLTYAGYAQLYFGYKTDDLANKNYSVPVDNVTAELVEDYNVAVSGNGALTYRAQTLSCRFSTIARYAFEIASGVNTDGFYAELENGGEGMDVTLTKSGSQLVVNVSDIAAAQLDDSYTVVIYDAEGNVQETLTAAPLAYVKTVLNNQKASDELVSLVKALYNYNAAANKVFAR